MPAFVLVAVLFSLFALSARAEGVPPLLAAALADDPEGAVDLAEDVIAAFGSTAGLTREDAQDGVALTRAEARASALRRYWAMDLDADGAVAGWERDVAMAAAASGSRSRLLKLHTTADVDGDGTVSAKESRLSGEAAAERAFGQDEAALLEALFVFDADGNGLLEAREVRQGVVSLAAGPGPGDGT